MTPLHNLCISWRDQSARVLELLLVAKAKIGARDHAGSTPLHYAAQNGHLKMVMLLLDASADVYMRDRVRDPYFDSSCVTYVWRIVWVYCAA